MSSVSDGFPWDRLAIAPTREAGEIRRAYARLLKALDAAADPGAFQSLRRAYESALGYAAGAGEPPPAPGMSRAPPALQPLLAEFVALGRKDEVAAAMAAVDRALSEKARPLDEAAALEAALFSAAIDDPEMPPALLAALARRFAWNDVGSAFEQHRPDLYDRYLYRLGRAHAWLAEVKELALRRDAVGRTARQLLARYGWRQRWRFVVAHLDRATLNALALEGWRLCPLLGDDAVDQRTLEWLRRRVAVMDDRHISRLRANWHALGLGLVICFALMVLVFAVSFGIAYLLGEA